MPDENVKRTASADALRALADNQDQTPEPEGPPPAPPAGETERNPLDALRAMADGEDLSSRPEPDEASAPGPAAEPEAEAPEAPPAGEDRTGLPSRQESLAARRARAQSLTGQSTKAQAHQFKRAMVPLLFVVGGLLMVLGMAVALMGFERTEESMFGGTMSKVAVVVAFPLAAILIFGGVYFHLEVRRSEQRDR